VILASLFLPGQLPSGKNAVIVTRTGLRFPKKRFTAWRDVALTAIRLQLGGHRDVALVTCDVSLAVVYATGDKRRRDLPGILDAICHLLEKSNILADDAQIKSCVWTPAKSGTPVGAWLVLEDNPPAAGAPWQPDPELLALPSSESTSTRHQAHNLPRLLLTKEPRRRGRQPRQGASLVQASTKGSGRPKAGTSVAAYPGLPKRP